MTFRDYKELLAEFNDHDVKYLIVGGYAVSLRGHPLRHNGVGLGKIDYLGRNRS